MPTITNKQAEDILRNVDPSTRRSLAGILSGSLISRIYCLSEDQYTGRGKNRQLVKEGCKGRLIGLVYDNGQMDAQGNPMIQIEPHTDENGFMWLRATRKRLDGFVGCECWCGNNSKIAKQEEGVLTHRGNTPTKEGLNQIFNELNAHPSNYKNINGRTVVDGFAFEGVA